jgi:hypothetical protein
MVTGGTITATNGGGAGSVNIASGTLILAGRNHCGGPTVGNQLGREVDF